MKKLSVLLGVWLCAAAMAWAQKTPTGQAKDFSVKPCLHSIGYAGVWRGQAQLTLDQFLLKAKELGYHSVMIMAKRPHLSPLDYDEAARKKLKARLAELDLKLVCLAGYSDFTAGIDKPGIPHIDIHAAYVGEVARLARDLGCDMVRIFTGYERPGIPYDKQYSQVLEGLKLAGREAAKYGVTLVVQNHHDIALHHEAMFWLLKEVNLPNVLAGWDAWSPTLEGLTPQEIRQSVFKMKPYLVHTICAQYRRHPRYHYANELTNYLRQDDVIRATAMTDPEGIIDYNTFIQALKEIGYQGYIAYEMCEVLDGGGSIENLDRAAKEFLKFLEPFK
ncbi:sugar phosphate isomerase/epimerase [bacterium]|nr:sugar phosphate isomerase/epimerase [bacterium]